MKATNRLTEGNILHTLIRFAVPVFFTLFLQALYGGVDLLVVGQFAATADVSGVATGSMLDVHRDHGDHRPIHGHHHSGGRAHRAG